MSRYNGLDCETQMRLLQRCDVAHESEWQQRATTSGHARQVAARKCAALDRQIDALVYALYGLTDAEIALVEERA